MATINNSYLAVEANPVELLNKGQEASQGFFFFSVLLLIMGAVFIYMLKSKEGMSSALLVSGFAGVIVGGIIAMIISFGSTVGFDFQYLALGAGFIVIGMILRAFNVD